MKRSTPNISPTQQAILDRMKQGCVLSSLLSTKYRPFDMPPEHCGTLRNPHVYHVFDTKHILISTIKAMLAKGLIAEESRSICSSGWNGKHEIETWCIHYKVAAQSDNENQERLRKAGGI